MSYPNPLTDEEERQLVNEVVEPHNDSIRYSACEALVSHGMRCCSSICQLLKSPNNEIVSDLLNALLSDVAYLADRPLQKDWDDNIISQIQLYLSSSIDDLRYVAILLVAKITRYPEQYAHYLCDLASKEQSVRSICMEALSYIAPVPLSCKAKLENLLIQYHGDHDFLYFVTNRISEIAPESSSPGQS